MPASDHPISEIMKSREPYIASDLTTERRLSSDEDLLNAGFRSFIDLPLIKQGELIGTIKFLSKEKGNYTDAQVCLLQDVADMVSLAVANALAYEEIKKLKEQLQEENRLLQVHDVAAEAVALARRGEGPSLIEADVVRLLAHSSSDHTVSQ